MIRLAHVWSSDIGLAGSLPHLRPFIERGWEVYGICPHGPRIADVEKAGVRWLDHSIERRWSVSSDLRGSLGLYELLRRHRFDIVHTHNAKTGVLARWIATAARVPVVVHTHNGLIYAMDSPFLFKYGAAALERLASAACDVAFVQSEDDYEALVRTWGAPESVLDLVGNGIDVERFNPNRFTAERREELRSAMGVDENDVLFFSAGRIVKEKGMLELFVAHERAAASNPRVKLAIAGPDDVERGLGIDPKILERAREHGVLLLGERKDMPELYAACDVVILPSWREGIPRVLIEGAAMGKPLIASDGRGCRRVVGPDWGFQVPLRDERALCDAMLRMAEGSALRERISRHNFEAARKKYDLRRIIARVDEVYADLLRARGIDPQRGAAASRVNGHATN